jgi:hypothetical protein
MEYKFINNAREEFIFFLDEENQPRLNINYENQLIAAYRLKKDELKKLRKVLKDMYKKMS